MQNPVLARHSLTTLALRASFLCATVFAQGQSTELRTAAPIAAAATPVLQPRQFATIAHDSTHHQFLLFGGTYGSQRFNDTWLLNSLAALGPVGWTPENLTRYPAARISSSAAYDPGNREYVLFGGRVQQATPASCSPGTLPAHLKTDYFCGDTWVYNFQTWVQMTPALSPSAREGHAMVYDAAHGQVVLFGGTAAASSTPLNDTWIWNGTTWKQALPAHSPPARLWHSMAYDPVHQQVLLFGGDSGTQFLNDTWIWNGTDWQPAPLQATPPPPRTSAGLDYDPVTDSMVLCSGTTWTTKRIGTPVLDAWSWNGSQWHQLPAASFQILTSFSNLTAAQLSNAILANGTPSVLWLPVK